MSREPLNVVELRLSLEDIARALFLLPDEASEQFRDPRLTGRLAEVWGTRLFGYQKHTNSNFAGSDGRIVLGPIGRYNISVRAFRNSLKFQQSKYMGSGRQCTQEDLVRSLENVEAVVAVDLRDFPRMLFYPLDSKWLLRLAREGWLSPSGITAKRFDRWVTSTFDVQIAPAAGWKLQEDVAA
jgi:hypothetical protein